MKAVYSFIRSINIGCHCVGGTVPNADHTLEHKTLKTKTIALPPGILDFGVVRQIND